MKHAITIAALALAAFATPALAVDIPPTAEANKAYLDNNAKKSGVVVVPGIQYRVIKSGYGDQPGKHDCVTVNYKGSLINGKVFDQTTDSQPATFAVNGVIAGWTEVLQMMHVGDDWEVTIPSGLAYGTQGAGQGVIPPNQTLVFEIELLRAFPATSGCG